MTAAIVSFSNAPKADAAGFHAYANGYDAAYPYRYTGVYEYRPDISITVSGNANCTVPYTGTPVYTTEWVQSADAKDFVELGTGHQCLGFTFHYWGYSSAGNWYSYGTEAVSGDGSFHYFDMHRLSSGGTAWWYYLIDGAQKFQLGWNFAGYYVSSGLESYDASAVANVHHYQLLQETFDEGPWYYWSMGSRTQRIDPGMCGAFVSNTDWKASENVTC